MNIGRWLDHPGASALFPVPVRIALSDAGWAKALKELSCKEFAPRPESEGCVTHFQQANGAKALVLSFRFAECRTQIERWGIIVHETQHILQAFKEALREEAMGAEVEASTAQWIAQWAAEELTRKGLLK